MDTTTLKAKDRQTTSEGFIVVAVLWILGALSVLVSIYAVYVIDTVPGVVVHETRFRAEGLVSAAIELTAYRQLTIPAQSRPTQGHFSFRLAPANVAVDFRSEAARIDLNAAPKQLLAGLFMALGARRDDAERYGDRIVTWRTPLKAGQETAASASRMASIGLEPRHANFANVSELSLVRDLPVAAVEAVMPFVTVYNEQPKVNVFDAAPEVIAALPGMNPDRISAVLALRQTSPVNKEAITQLLGPAQQYAATEGSRAFRVDVKITFDNGYRTSSESVILLFEKGNEPYSVLSWQDEIPQNTKGQSLARLR